MSTIYPLPWFIQGSIGTDKKQVRDANGTPVDFNDPGVVELIVAAVNAQDRNDLMLTIGVLIAAAGGKIEVPPSVKQNLPARWWAYDDIRNNQTVYEAR